MDRIDVAATAGRTWDWYGQCPQCKKRTKKQYKEDGWSIYCPSCGYVVETHWYTKEEREQNKG